MQKTLVRLALIEFPYLFGQIDKEILSKLNERASFAKKVGEIKQRVSGDEKVAFYRPEREANILREIIDKNEGALPNESVANVFRQIISACRAHESPMRIAFLGSQESYAHWGFVSTTSGDNLSKNVCY